MYVTKIVLNFFRAKNLKSAYFTFEPLELSLVHSCCIYVRTYDVVHQCVRMYTYHGAGDIINTVRTMLAWFEGKDNYVLLYVPATSQPYIRGTSYINTT